MQNRKHQTEYPGTRKRGDVYHAQVHKDNQQIYLGAYPSQYEAHLVSTYYKAINFTHYTGIDLAKVPLPAGTIKHPYFSNALLHEILKINTIKGVQAINYFK